MRLFAIGDLHLAASVDKPMAIFGKRWENHVEQIRDKWTSTVGADDTVLVAGDISWANSLEEALPDLTFLDQLPGHKILLRGNHDYWWATMRKNQDFCQAHDLLTLDFLRNDALEAAGFHICGSRGWLLPTDEAFTESDRKVFKREMIRLDLSLQSLARLRKKDDVKRPALALMHYPPLDEKGRPSDFCRLLEEAGVEVCLFGHIHHRAPYYESRPLLGGIRYIMVASDQLRFKPLLIGEEGQFADLAPKET
ncbi:MAG TPA: metallophosphoesterase [Clostridia bacterium]|nr:metallophosphoesterase [Clostridia bacterium]